MPSPRTKNGPQSKPLSEVARHLVLPEGIVTTGWPSVRDKCKLLGIAFDPWQDGAGRAILAKRKSGKYAAGVGGVVLSIPRQVGKTFLIGSIVFALCLLEPRLKVIWTAHHTKTADETFESMQEMANRAKVKPFIRRILTGGGKQIIHFSNGSRIEFGARESGFGRGKTKVGVLVLDEASILTEKAMENLVPTVNQCKNPLIFLMGTPPRPFDAGEVFTNRRLKALEGKSKDTLYIEFSADRDARLDDRKQWAVANPSYPFRTDTEAILRMREMLPSDDAFRREGLGVWDEVLAGTRAVQFPRWRRLTVTAEEAPQVGVTVFAVRFSVNGLVAAVGVARRPPSGPIHVEGVEVFDMAAGIAPIVDFLVGKADSAAHIVVDGKSGADLLIQALRDRGVRNKRLIVKMTPDLVTQACSSMLQALAETGLSHIGQPVLDRQVEVAVPRKIGNFGGFGWGAPDGEDVSLFEAVTYAFLFAKTTKSRRGASADRGVVLL